MEEAMKTAIAERSQALVYCPICTHTVEAEAGLLGKKPLVTPGQKCPRCHSSLEVAVVVQIPEAA